MQSSMHVQHRKLSASYCCQRSLDSWLKRLGIGDSFAMAAESSG
jgi:hypothetical protein